MRKVIVREHREVGKKWKLVDIGEALFHQWGCDYDEFEMGPGNYSTAIVEFSDGTIKNLAVTLIRFVD